MSKFFSALLLVTVSVTAFAEPAKYCLVSGYLNDIVYRYEANCSDGKYYFRDSFLGPISSSRRAATKAKLVGDLGRAGLSYTTNVGGYELYTQGWNAFDAQKNSLCLVFSNGTLRCTAGVSVKVDVASGESVDSALRNTGFSQVLNRNGVRLFIK